MWVRVMKIICIHYHSKSRRDDSEAELSEKLQRKNKKVTIRKKLARRFLHQAPMSIN